jgi:hypothetical protein
MAFVIGIPLVGDDEWGVLVDQVVVRERQELGAHAVEFLEVLRVVFRPVAEASSIRHAPRSSD